MILSELLLVHRACALPVGADSPIVSKDRGLKINQGPGFVKMLGAGKMVKNADRRTVNENYHFSRFASQLGFEKPRFGVEMGQKSPAS
jgi:hypothetical protein